jgi:GNAT superfamily N-acetyltransferase
MELALRDGTPVVVRPIRPDDADALRAAFDRLGPESRYRRFMAPVPRLSDATVRYFTEVDHHDHEALVALDPATGEGVGVARYVRVGDGSAEAAVTVADDWQGRGVGTLLLDALAARAREEGVGRFTASMLATNRDMLDLFRKLGPTRVTGASGSTVEIDAELPDRGAGDHLKGLLKCAATADRPLVALS